MFASKVDSSMNDAVTFPFPARTLIVYTICCSSVMVRDHYFKSTWPGVKPTDLCQHATWKMLKRRASSDLDAEGRLLSLFDRLYERRRRS